MSPQAADETRTEQISRPKKNKRKAEREQLVVARLGRHHRRQLLLCSCCIRTRPAPSIFSLQPRCPASSQSVSTSSQPPLNLLSTSLLSFSPFCQPLSPTSLSSGF
ncbi:hypothetical protein I7I48_06075 [Histoplasma ohiense]|nr:hypothetical protein I7I48_06075 [Histoplasma ohiense (nom. inval.)]